MIDFSHLKIKEYIDESDFGTYIEFVNGGTKISKECLHDIISIVGYDTVNALLNKINDANCRFILRCIPNDEHQKYILLAELY